MFEDYLATSEKIGIKRKQEETVFGMKLGRLVTLKRIRKTMLVDDGRAGTESARVWCYCLPDLESARAQFGGVLQQDVKWPVIDAGETNAADADLAARGSDVVPL